MILVKLIQLSRGHLIKFYKTKLITCNLHCYDGFVMQKNVKLGETYYQPVHQEDKSTHESAFEKTDKW